MPITHYLISVDSVICQVAKAQGLRVISSAGSDSKVAFLKELGVDVAFNYKKQDIATVLKDNGGVDIYWDNVGGKALETVMGCMNKWGRIIVSYRPLSLTYRLKSYLTMTFLLPSDLWIHLRV